MDMESKPQSVRAPTNEQLFRLRASVVLECSLEMPTQLADDMYIFIFLCVYECVQLYVCVHSVT